MKSFLLKLRGVGEILRYFANPLLVIAMRLGFVRLPVFLYRIEVSRRHFAMLARPSTAAMADLFVLREVLVEETYRDLLPLLPPGPARVVDVGGNIGSFSIWLHQRHGLREGFCFEPDPGSFDLCSYNLANNGCRFVQVFPKAIGGVGRTITMRVNTNRPGGNSIYASHDGGGDSAQVEVLGFSDWLRPLEGEFDVLKLDCEGAEWEILDHTPPELFRRFKVIIAEIHQDQAGRHALADFAEGLSRHGFKCLRWDGHEQGLYFGQRLNPT